MLVTDDCGGEECARAWTRGNDKDIPALRLIFPPSHIPAELNRIVSLDEYEYVSVGYLYILDMCGFESKYLHDKWKKTNKSKLCQCFLL